MIKTLSSLLIRTIQNLYASEDHMLQELPSIIEKVKHTSLKNALNHHLSLTSDQKKRLEKILFLINEHTNEEAKLSPGCISKGMIGLLEEAKEILETGLEADVTDAAIIAAIQKMEHYEISSYGTAVAYARQLQITTAEALLNETLDEEYEADDLLTALATASLNKEAVHEDVKTLNNQGNDKSNDESTGNKSEVHITERTINSPGGRAGTSHRRYGTGESRGH